jgi:hypothetical protein
VCSFPGNPETINSHWIHVSSQQQPTPLNNTTIAETTTNSGQSLSYRSSLWPFANIFSRL